MDKGREVMKLARKWLVMETPLALLITFIAIQCNNKSKSDISIKLIVGFNYNDFELETTEVDYDLAKTTIQFQVKIKNKNDPNDVAIYISKNSNFC